MKVEILQRLPLFCEEKLLTCTPLERGLCGDDFHLIGECGEYFVRVFKKTHILERDRENERMCQFLASKEGIASKVLFINDTLIVCEFIQGEHLGMVGDSQIRQIAMTLKKLHMISYKGEPFSLLDYFDYHVSEAKDSEFIQADDPLIQTTRRRIKGLVPLPHVLCHNNLSIRNLLFNEKVMFSNWEYAGMNDRYFDLATVAENFDLSLAEKQMLLMSYDDMLPLPMGLKRLEDFRLIRAVLNALWFSLQEESDVRLKAARYLESAYTLL